MSGAAPIAAMMQLAGDDEHLLDLLEEGEPEPKAVASPEEVAAAEAKKAERDARKVQLRKRAQLAKIHRTLGITTWALTGLAVIAGGIQYHNLYGGKTAATTPCVQGKAWLGQDQCSGQPWFHALTGFAAGAAYFSTLGLAIAMPDPTHADVGNSKYARTLRTHKILRWVHLSGMLAQMVLGIVIANPKLQGDLNRSSDYKTQKSLAAVHMTTGLITLGSLSWAGTIMLL
ncbi:MAG: hypothetical protein ABW252_02525 [Polyangiales bacterium]